jgi:hypothetical protein
MIQFRWNWETRGERVAYPAYFAVKNVSIFCLGGDVHHQSNPEKGMAPAAKIGQVPTPSHRDQSQFGLDDGGNWRLNFLSREGREGGEVRRTGLFVETQRINSEAP